MDNKGFRIDVGEPPTYNEAESNQREKKPTAIRKSYVRTKSQLQTNKYTNSFFPPRGEVATTLTLLLSIFTIFVAARAVLGPIADIGGTIFALLILILLALIGGKSLEFLSFLMRKYCNVDIRLPPLLGMLIVGIILKNVPYNFGQFGRAECTKDHLNATLLNITYVDSLTEFDEASEHNSWKKRSVPDDIAIEDIALDRVVRSVSGHHDEETKSADNEKDLECHERYIGHDLDPYISRTLRQVCLTVILLMAGLELDPVQLSRLSGMVVRATFIPCLTEALAVAIFSNLLLGLPWTVGFMLGFILAAVSPAVIIPSLMSLSGRGYGLEKGIPTLVIAACAADDVVAISGFGIFLGVTFSFGAPLWKLILHGPIEVLIGVVFGGFWGVLAQWIPNKGHRHVAFFRWLVLFGGGLIALFGAHLIHYDGAGGLATIIMAFVAGMQWRAEGWGEHNPVSKTFQRMWIILQPVIFALIGTEIQVDKINATTLGYSLLVLALALIIRMGATYLAVMGGDLNWKEKVFMAFAWLPKATVQAALGPIFLDNVLRFQGDWDDLGDKNEWITMGNDILTLAVLSILITAPLGAISILALGPKLLEQDPRYNENGKIENDEENELS